MYRHGSAKINKRSRCIGFNVTVASGLSFVALAQQGLGQASNELNLSSSAILNGRICRRPFLHGTD